jgi:preprotein translocase SecF subunit
VLKSTIDFLKYRWIAFGVSLGLLVVFSAVAFTRGGINMGVDFIGGVKIIGQFYEGVDEAKIREALRGFNPMIQQIGSDDKHEYIISSKLTAESQNSEIQSELIKKALLEQFTTVEFLSVENVGPAIGDFLKKSALKLFLVAVALMGVYLAFRFEFKYSIAAMAAIIHDLVLAVMFCGFTGVEFNIPIVAALLTIFGYSINDTIVIFDRIRENMQQQTKQAYIDIVNRAITQSLSRTLLTSLTTLFAVLSLYLIGGEGINDFALILLFGIVIGTYSTVYLAAPVLVAWERFKAR